MVGSVSLTAVAGQIFVCLPIYILPISLSQNVNNPLI
jgi:hypothetical protein